MSFFTSLFRSGSKDPKPPPASPRKNNNNSNNTNARRGSVSPTPSQTQNQNQNQQQYSTTRSQRQQQNLLQSPKCTPQKMTTGGGGHQQQQQRRTGNPTNRPASNKAPLSPRPGLMGPGVGNSLSSNSNLFSSLSQSQQQQLSQQQQNQNSSRYSSFTSTSYNPSLSQQHHHASFTNQPTKDSLRVTVRVRPPPVMINLVNDGQNQQQPPQLNSPGSQPGCVLISDELANQLFIQGRHEPFAFHRVLSESTSQLDCYNITTKPLLDDALNGFNCCLFAYGQSGSGKSYSIVGDRKTYTPSAGIVIKQEKPDKICPSEDEAAALHAADDENSSDNANENNTTEEEEDIPVKTEKELEEEEEQKHPFIGMIPRLCKDLFKRIEVLKREGSKTSWMVSINFCEIYNELAFDLFDPNYTNIASSFTLNNANVNNNLLAQLNSKSLEVREDTTSNRFFVENQTQIPVTSAEQVIRYMEKGLSARRVAETCMNERSSRSHALFQLVLEEVRIGDGNNTNEPPLRIAKINLVDLAGSENAKKTEAQGQQKIEGGHINKSLLALRQVIDERAQGNSFVSYRNSVLTKLLKDSLGGNSKTSMLACVSPLEQHMDETLNTLRYAGKAASITNTVRVNERHLLSPAPNQYANQVSFLTTQVQDLEEKLKSETANTESHLDTVNALNRNLVSAKQDAEDRCRLYAIQQEEINELKRQLEASKKRENESLSSAVDAAKHFKSREESTSSQLEILRSEHEAQKKRWEKSKMAEISRLEKQIERNKQEFERSEAEHLDAIAKLNTESSQEKNRLLEKLQHVQEEAKKREEELEENIEAIRREKENHKAVMNGMFAQQIEALNQESAAQIASLKEEIESLENSKTQQQKLHREEIQREQKTISTLQNLIAQHESKISSMETENKAEVEFYKQRNLVLEETVLRLQNELLRNRQQQEQEQESSSKNLNLEQDASPQITTSATSLGVPNNNNSGNNNAKTPSSARRRQRQDDNDEDNTNDEKENNEEGDLF